MVSNLNKTFCFVQIGNLNSRLRCVDSSQCKLIGYGLVWTFCIISSLSPNFFPLQIFCLDAQIKFIHSLTHSILHSLLSTHDVVFKRLNDEDKIRYLLTLENENTSKIVGKYTYLMFQKRKEILNSKYN